MPPPRLSPESAARLTAVVGAADDAVDAGSAPDTAIAKAARDHAMPIGHVPLVVRAFNTGRAVRQLESSTDPWEKAAAYPQASEGGVLAALGVTAVKQAATPSTADYDTPPPDRKPPVVKAAGFAAPAALPTPTGRAAVTVFNEYASLAKAAAAYDAMASLCERYPAADYVAAKSAALADFPDAAGYAFTRLEAENPWVREKAAATPNHATKTATHPIVLAVAELHAAKAGCVRRDSSASADHDPVEGAIGWSTPKPRCPHLGLVVPTKIATASPAEPIEPPLVGFDATKAAGFSDALSGFKSVMGGAKDVLTSDKLVQPAISFGQSPEQRAAKLEATSDKVKSQTNADLGQVDFQSHIQDVLADPRFAQQDPKMVVDTYRQLYQLAPSAMQNPAVAGDFIQRRLQTGPLSYFDLKALTDIQKNLMSAGRNNVHDDDE